MPKKTAPRRPRPSSPRDSRTATPPRRTVIVRFKNHIQIPYEDGAEKHLPAKITRWAKILKIRKECALRKILVKTGEKHIQALTQRAAKRNPGYQPPRLLHYFGIDCPTEETAEALVKELKTWDAVETAYVARPASNPEVNLGGATPNAYWRFQRHLESAPTGVGARDVWPLPGADGAGISVIDLEMGWTLEHQDFARHRPQLIPAGVLIDHARHHGTKALGVICASGEPDRCVGIAPHPASVNVISFGNDETTIDDCILTAAQLLSPGDVLVLEVHLTGANLPCESEAMTFDAIRLAVDSGIVVVEAAGNGNSDLDVLSGPVARRLNRKHPAFEDSGAILVGAGWIPPNSPTQLWQPLPVTNQGSRIDCFAEGSGVFTTSTRETGGDPPWSTDHYDFFSGTSSATAIIAGVALSVQGMAKANSANSQPLAPDALRRLLMNLANGTASRNPAADKIGVMPNLAAISQLI